MQRVSLAGTWTRSVAGHVLDFVNVPGSYRPVGECELAREFELPEGNGRLFLVTEGVLATAEFIVNGQVVGKAGPWARYRFELPRDLLKARNVMVARVRDSGEAFGPAPGRRWDAGLVREIYLERRPATFIEGFHFQSGLNEECTAAEATVAVEFNGAGARAAEVTLVDARGRVVATGVAKHDEPARLHLEEPRLWSPAEPYLYELKVRLQAAGDRLQEESVSERVGFRRIEVRERDFYLNNERIVLKGICRHEFTSASGYSPSPEEVRRELALIKHTGFNYIRLVHSPQGPEVCRIAAELGLLVSEEPGTCFHDLADPAIYGPALECLVRTVKRDRNVPSIFAWLIYNECLPNAEYAAKAAAAVRGLDPDARLSFADCSGKNDEIKKMVEAGGLSYYGINVYDYWAKTYLQRMEAFPDKPLVFTEWGGLTAQGNPRVMRDLTQTFARHSRKGEWPRMSGCAYWVWADYEEKTRGAPGAIEGWTIEGLLDKWGQPKADLQALSLMCFEMDHPPLAHAPVVEVLTKARKRDANWQAVDLSQVTIEAGRMEKKLEDWRRGTGGMLPRLGRVMVDGIGFACREGGPVLIGAGRREVVIPVGRQISALAVLGHVAHAGGYPSSSVQTVWSEDTEPPRKAGDSASEYELVFEDGRPEIIPLRHGVEVLRANEICRWWAVNPIAPGTRPALRVVVHPSFEILRIDLWEYRLPRPRYLKELRWKLADEQSVQAMWAVSVES